MYNRRNFINLMGAASLATGLLKYCTNDLSAYKKKPPIIISTWDNQQANKIALQWLEHNKKQLLTAIEKGINSVENNPDDMSVGLGGLPDRTGTVTLDACIMDHEGNAGAVTYLKDISNAVSVARKIMELTPHVTLSGEGAQAFALDNGFKKQELLTEKANKLYQEWLQTPEYKPRINAELHDTIGMLAMAEDGSLAGACSTSGLAYKLPGRVGDSPVIGAGLFVDNEVGAATATGLGEMVLKSCSSFLVVELMRQGFHPEKACKNAISRMAKRYDCSNLQVGLIAIDKMGQTGAFAVQKGFVYALSDVSETTVIEADSYYK